MEHSTPHLISMARELGFGQVRVENSFLTFESEGARHSDEARAHSDPTSERSSSYASFASGDVGGGGSNAPSQLSTTFDSNNSGRLVPSKDKSFDGEGVDDQDKDISEEESSDEYTKQELEQFQSKGSAKHGEGKCRPCLFVNASIGCHNGVTCDFCHFPHKKKNNPRPCKGKRERYRRMVGRMETQIDENPAALHLAMSNLPPSIQEDEGLKMKLRNKMEKRAARARAQHQEQRELTTSRGSTLLSL